MKLPSISMYRTKRFSELKVAEEAQEVALAYLHIQSKGNSHRTEFLKELSHLKLCIILLEDLLSEEETALVREEMNRKLKQIEGRVERDIAAAKAMFPFADLTPDMVYIAHMANGGKE